MALRLARQQLLARPDPPEYWVVLDETVLRRPVGGHEVIPIASRATHSASRRD